MQMYMFDPNACVDAVPCVNVMSGVTRQADRRPELLSELITSSAFPARPSSRQTIPYNLSLRIYVRDVFRNKYSLSVAPPKDYANQQ